MIIAVDGPAASGKGTIGRALAEHYRLPHLDTGLLYRAVGLSVLRAGGDPDSEADALSACDFDDALLADPELRSESTGAMASRVSIHPAVRKALVQRQRDFANQPSGAVLDGRDMNRPVAPLKRAEGAALLDTSDLSIEAAVQQAIALVDALVEGQRAN